MYLNTFYRGTKLPASGAEGWSRTHDTLVGGVLLEHYWWGSVVLVGVPIMVVLLIVGPMLLPEYRDPDAGRPDVLSGLPSITTMLSVIYGLKQVVQNGLTWLPCSRWWSVSASPRSSFVASRRWPTRWSTRPACSDRGR